MLLFAACGGSSNDDVEPVATGATATVAPATASQLPDPVEDRSEHPWKIVVSLPWLADFVHIMAEDQATVTTLIPPGVDPHTYVPTDNQVAAVQEADIVFVNGLGLDQPTIDFIDANHPDNRLFVLDIARNIPSPTTPQPAGGIPIYATDVGDNPHLWLDPELVPIYAESVSHSFIIIDGINEPFYNERYLRYRQQLKDLQASIEARMQQIPAENRGLLVTEHNSLIHFARRYGLEVAATIADDGEDGVAQVLEQLRPPAVFTEAGHDATALTGLANAAGIEVCKLYTETIDDPAMTFLEMLDHNANEIVRCLGG